MYLVCDKTKKYFKLPAPEQWRRLSFFSTDSFELDLTAEQLYTIFLDNFDVYGADDMFWLNKLARYTRALAVSPIRFADNKPEGYEAFVKEMV